MILMVIGASFRSLRDEMRAQDQRIDALRVNRWACSKRGKGRVDDIQELCYEPS